MSNARFLFLIATVLLGMMLWTEWSKEQALLRAANAPATPVATQGSSDVPASSASVPSGDVPAASAPAAAAASPTGAPGEVPVAALPTPVESASVNASSRKIQVRTDLIDAEIDLAGGDFSRMVLKQYKRGVDPDPEGPVLLFDSSPANWYRAQTGWAGNDNMLGHELAVFDSARDSYEFEGSASELEVPLTATVGELEVRKVYRFKRGSYVVGVRYEIRNNGSTPWTGTPYRQLQRLPGVLPGGFFVSNPETFSFVGAAVYAAGSKFHKLGFDDFIDEPFNQKLSNGWSAMLQHHFVSVWVPSPQELVDYSTVQLNATAALPIRYLIRQVSPPQTVAPGATLNYEVQLFAGPKLQAQLTPLAPGLELAVDYGIFTFIAKPLFWLLDFFHSLVKNWGFAIILLTIVVKLALYKLSEAQYKSMAKMRKLQPRLQALQERYRDDRQKYGMAMMELYKTEKVNPIGGCLPLLLQIPVFFALYCVVLESAELRQAPFMLWITDLSRQDPYYVLPVLNVVLMWYTQKLTPMAGMDPTQQKIMQFMPLMMGVLFAFFPAGLVLYWCMQSGLGLLQQVYIMRKFADTPKAA